MEANRRGYIEVEDVTRKDGEVSYCRNQGEVDENLLQARDLYRENHGLLTSAEIACIRKYYDLSQRDFALLLGWDEENVAAYETKVIQDKTDDSMMRMIFKNPIFVMDNLLKRKDNFSEQDFDKIKNAVEIHLQEKKNSICVLKTGDDILLETTIHHCPLCWKIHEVEVYKRPSKGIVEGEIVEFDEIIYICPDSKDKEGGNEFVPHNVFMENSMRKHRAYDEKHRERKEGLNENHRSS